MAIRFDCPACGKPLEANDEMAGKSGTCPQCKKQITVPDPPSPAAAG